MDLSSSLSQTPPTPRPSLSISPPEIKEEGKLVNSAILWIPITHIISLNPHKRRVR